MSYEQDIFYKVHDLSQKEKIDIMNYSKNISYEWWTDKLDCSESWARQRIDMSFDDIMKKFSASSHFVVIHRRGSMEHKNTEIWKWKGEVGFSTMGGEISYYLWIHLTEDEFSGMIKKFKLSKMS